MWKMHRRCHLDTPAWPRPHSAGPWQRANRLPGLPRGLAPVTAGGIVAAATLGTNHAGLATASRTQCGAGGKWRDHFRRAISSWIARIISCGKRTRAASPAILSNGNLGW